MCLRAEFRGVMSLTISAYKRCSVRLYLQLFVWGSCLFYVMCVCLPIVVWFFFLFFSGVLCTLSCQFLWIIHYLLLLRYSLTFTWLCCEFSLPHKLVPQFEKHSSQKQVMSFTIIPQTLSMITTCTCKVPITCLPVSPARSFWTFGHCDFVTKTYFKVQFSCVLPNWTLLWTTLQ